MIEAAGHQTRIESIKHCLSANHDDAWISENGAAGSVGVYGGEGPFWVMSGLWAKVCFLACTRFG